MNEKLRKFQKFDYQKEIEKRKQIEEKQKQLKKDKYISNN